MSAFIEQLRPHISAKPEDNNPANTLIQSDIDKGWRHVRRGHETDVMMLLKLAIPSIESLSHRETEELGGGGGMTVYAGAGADKLPIYVKYVDPHLQDVLNIRVAARNYDERFD